MNYKEDENLCPLCGGSKKQGLTTYSVDMGTGVVVIRNVRATICEQCGEEWIDNQTAKELENIVEEARKKHSQVEIIAFS